MGVLKRRYDRYITIADANIGGDFEKTFIENKKERGLAISEAEIFMNRILYNAPYSRSLVDTWNPSRIDPMLSMHCTRTILCILYPKPIPSGTRHDSLGSFYHELSFSACIHISYSFLVVDLVILQNFQMAYSTLGKRYANLLTYSLEPRVRSPFGDGRLPRVWGTNRLER